MSVNEGGGEEDTGAWGNNREGYVPGCMWTPVVVVVGEEEVSKTPSCYVVSDIVNTDL